jgi:hypothetical protein
MFEQKKSAWKDKEITRKEEKDTSEITIEKEKPKSRLLNVFSKKRNAETPNKSGHGNKAILMFGKAKK